MSSRDPLLPKNTSGSSFDSQPAHPEQKDDKSYAPPESEPDLPVHQIPDKVPSGSVAISGDFATKTERAQSASDPFNVLKNPRSEESTDSSKRIVKQPFLYPQFSVSSAANKYINTLEEKIRNLRELIRRAEQFEGGETGFFNMLYCQKKSWNNMAI